jgi:hypothetical protein
MLRPELLRRISANQTAERSCTFKSYSSVGNEGTQELVGRRSRHTGCGRRRSMRSLQHAHAVPEMSPGSHRGVARSPTQCFPSVIYLHQALHPLASSIHPWKNPLAVVTAYKSQPWASAIWECPSFTGMVVAAKMSCKAITGRCGGALPECTRRPSEARPACN